MNKWIITIRKEEVYLYHECEPHNPKKYKAWVSSVFKRQACTECHESIPDHIKIQLKLLHPKRWGYLWTGK